MNSRTSEIVSNFNGKTFFVQFYFPLCINKYRLTTI